ncbi:hypothetical protein, partial [Clostridium sp. CMCC3678]|uniref:hypothetical protein n=1 Tax=Clostridium sp. CMCC3678 TaxID=2949962 RepID=UPI002079C1E7
NTLIGLYNDKVQIKELFKKYGNEIAAVIIEPVAGNMGVIKATINTSNKSATINPSQKSFKRLLKN